MLQILLVTFPFFALVFCGWLATRWRMLPLAAIPGLNSFVLFFALPCMLYRFGAGTPITRLLDAGVFTTWLLCALMMVALTIITTREGRIGWNDASFGALVAAFPNSGFMGVPLLVSLLGTQAAGPVILTMALDMVLTSSLCVALSRLDTADGHGARRAVWKALKGIAVNPLPWSIVLGCISSATGLALPAPVNATLGMLADAASPTALFTIGAVLARSQAMEGMAPAPRRIGDVPLVAFYKLFVHPALVFCVGLLAAHAGLPIDHPTITVLVLTAALPSASNAPMLAERFGADTGRVARIVMVSTVLSFLTFSTTVALVR
jgi:predicted permease